MDRCPDPSPTLTVEQLVERLHAQADRTHQAQSELWDATENAGEVYVDQELVERCDQLRDDAALLHAVADAIAGVKAGWPTAATSLVRNASDRYAARREAADAEPPRSGLG